MKTALIAALALTMPGLALAQAAPQTRPAPTGSGIAAGTLPNTMDGPAAAQATRPAARPAAARAPAQDTAEPAQASTPEQIAAAEAALKATIAAAQSGTMNYDDMTDSLAEQVRAQEATVTPILQGFGALQDVEHRGQENGAELFLVTFAEEVTQWIVGLDPEGQIAILLFRPAPPLDSAE